jgi:hypothetical protein
MTAKDIAKDLQAWLNRFKDLRDGLLVAVGVLYILGYAVWTIYAAINHLGLFAGPTISV